MLVLSWFGVASVMPLRRRLSDTGFSEFFTASSSVTLKVTDGGGSKIVTLSVLLRLGRSVCFDGEDVALMVPV